MSNTACIQSIVALALASAFSLQPSFLVSAATPMGTVFTYQGRLTVGTNPANGPYALQFMLYDAASGGAGVSGLITNSPVGVTDGQFTAVVMR